MSDNIVVALRVRPLIAREIQDAPKLFWKVDADSIIQIEPDTKKPIVSSEFDKVFDSNITNHEIYEDVALPIVQSALTGINGTIFAYGQTASGKTFTMTGNRTTPGIIPLSIHDIFQSIENTPDREFLLRASYMEIYQENISDLLTGLKIASLREDSSGAVYVPGLKEVCVTSESMLLEVMADGDKRRKVAETNMNERSSRSHSIFRLIVESRETSDKECDGAITVSHLNLVDLAGSENASQTGATGERLKEGSSINKSLFMLGRVISQLSDDEAFVNFRDSKLTRILQTSLGGNAKTVMICTITPANREQSLSTVRFASRAKSIKNKPIVNEVLSEAALLKRYAVEIKKLKSALQNERNTDKAQEVEQVKEKLDEQERQNMELQEKLKSLKEKMVVSSLNKDQPSNKEKKTRRETWAAPAIKRFRRSEFNSIRAPFLLPGPWDSGNPRFSSISEEDSTDSYSPDDHASPEQNHPNNSCASIASFHSPSESVFQNNEISKLEGLENSFLSPEAIPKRSRQRKCVNFANVVSSFPNFKDVECQTENSLLPKPLPLEQLTPKAKKFIEIFTTPPGVTPREVLRCQNKELKENLQLKEEWLENWSSEIIELSEFQKKEIQTLSDSFCDKLGDGPTDDKVIILEREIRSLSKSLKDSELLYLDINKVNSEQAQEIINLRKQVILLTQERDKCLMSSEDSSLLSEENLKLKKSLAEKETIIVALQHDKEDFDMILELALQKQKQIEKDLRISLDDAWTEIADFEGGSKLTVQNRFDATFALNAELSTLKNELCLYKSEESEIRMKMVDLGNKLQKCEEELAETKRMNREYCAEVQNLQEKLQMRKLLPLKSEDSEDCNSPFWTTAKDMTELEMSRTNMSYVITPSEMSQRFSETINSLEEVGLSSIVKQLSNLPLDLSDPTAVDIFKDMLLKLQDYYTSLGQQFQTTQFSFQDMDATIFEAKIQTNFTFYQEVLHDYDLCISTLNLLESVCCDYYDHVLKKDKNERVLNKSDCEIERTFKLGLSKLQESFNKSKDFMKQMDFESFLDEKSPYMHDHLLVNSNRENLMSLADELKMTENDSTFCESDIECGADVEETFMEISKNDLYQEISKLQKKEEKYIDEMRILEEKIRILESSLKSMQEASKENVDTYDIKTENEGNCSLSEGKELREKCLALEKELAMLQNNMFSDSLEYINKVPAVPSSCTLADVIVNEIEPQLKTCIDDDTKIPELENIIIEKERHIRQLENSLKPHLDFMKENESEYSNFKKYLSAKAGNDSITQDLKITMECEEEITRLQNTLLINHGNNSEIAALEMEVKEQKTIIDKLKKELVLKEQGNVYLKDISVSGSNSMRSQDEIKNTSLLNNSLESSHLVDSNMVEQNLKVCIENNSKIAELENIIAEKDHEISSLKSSINCQIVSKDDYEDVKCESQETIISLTADKEIVSINLNESTNLENIDELKNVAKSRADEFEIATLQQLCNEQKIIINELKNTTGIDAYSCYNTNYSGISVLCSSSGKCSDNVNDNSLINNHPTQHPNIGVQSSFADASKNERLIGKIQELEQQKCKSFTDYDFKISVLESIIAERETKIKYLEDALKPQFVGIKENECVSDDLAAPEGSKINSELEGENTRLKNELLFKQLDESDSSALKMECQEQKIIITELKNELELAKSFETGISVSCCKCSVTENKNLSLQNIDAEFPLAVSNEKEISEIRELELHMEEKYCNMSLAKQGSELKIDDNSKITELQNIIDNKDKEIAFLKQSINIQFKSIHDSKITHFDSEGPFSMSQVENKVFNESIIEDNVVELQGVSCTSHIDESETAKLKLKYNNQKNVIEELEKELELAKHSNLIIRGLSKSCSNIDSVNVSGITDDVTIESKHLSLQSIDLELTHPILQENINYISKIKEQELHLKENHSEISSLKHKLEEYTITHDNCSKISVLQNIVIEKDNMITELENSLKLMKDSKETHYLHDQVLEEGSTNNELIEEINQLKQALSESLADVSELITLREKFDEQKVILDALRLELEEYKDKEDELESMITDFTMKDAELEERECTLNEKELKLSDLINKNKISFAPFEIEIADKEKCIIELKELIFLLQHQNKIDVCEADSCKISDPKIFDDTNEFSKLNMLQHEINFQKNVDGARTEKGIHAEFDESQNNILLLKSEKESLIQELDLLKSKYLLFEQLVQFLYDCNVLATVEIKNNSSSPDVEENLYSLDVIQQVIENLKCYVLSCQSKLSQEAEVGKKSEDLKIYTFNLENSNAELKSNLDSQEKCVGSLNTLVYEKEKKLLENQKVIDDIQAVLQDSYAEEDFNGDILVQKINHMKIEWEKMKEQCKLYAIKSDDEGNQLEIDISLNLEMISIKEQLQNEKRLVQSCNEELSNKKSYIKILETRIVDLEQNLSDKEVQLSSTFKLNQDIEIKVKENERLLENFVNLESVLCLRNKELSQLKTNNEEQLEVMFTDLKNKEEKILQLSDCLKNTEDKLTTAENMLQSNENKKDSLKLEVEELLQSLNDRNNTIENLLKDKDRLQSNIDNIKEELIKIQTPYDELISAKHNLNEELCSRQQEIEELFNICNALKTEKENIAVEAEALVESLEGVQEELQRALIILSSKDKEIQELKFSLDAVEEEHAKCGTEMEKLIVLMEKYELEAAEKDSNIEKLLNDNKKRASETLKIETDIQKLSLEKENNLIAIKNLEEQEKLDKKEIENLNYQTEEIKMQLNEAEIKILEFKGENDKLIEEILPLKLEKDELYQLFNTVEVELLQMTCEELDTTNPKSEKAQVCREIKNVKSKLQTLCSENKRNIQILEKLENSNYELNLKLQKVQQQLTDAESETNVFRNQNEKLLEEFQILQQENQEIHKLLETTKYELLAVTERELCFKSLKSEKEKLEQEKEKLLVQLQELTIDNENTIQIKRDLELNFDKLKLTQLDIKAELHKAEMKNNKLKCLNEKSAEDILLLKQENGELSKLLDTAHAELHDSSKEKIKNKNLLLENEKLLSENEKLNLLIENYESELQAHTLSRANNDEIVKNLEFNIEILNLRELEVKEELSNAKANIAGLTAHNKNLLEEVQSLILEKEQQNQLLDSFKKELLAKKEECKLLDKELDDTIKEFRSSQSTLCKSYQELQGQVRVLETEKSRLGDTLLTSQSNNTLTDVSFTKNSECLAIPHGDKAKKNQKYDLLLLEKQKLNKDLEHLRNEKDCKIAELMTEINTLQNGMLSSSYDSTRKEEVTKLLLHISALESEIKKLKNDKSFPMSTSQSELENLQFLELSKKFTILQEKFYQFDGMDDHQLKEVYKIYTENASLQFTKTEDALSNECSERFLELERENVELKKTLHEKCISTIDYSKESYHILLLQNNELTKQIENTKTELHEKTEECKLLDKELDDTINEFRRSEKVLFETKQELEAHVEELEKEKSMLSETLASQSTHNFTGYLHQQEKSESANIPSKDMLLTVKNYDLLVVENQRLKKDIEHLRKEKDAKISELSKGINSLRSEMQLISNKEALENHNHTSQLNLKKMEFMELKEQYDALQEKFAIFDGMNGSQLNEMYSHFTTSVTTAKSKQEKDEEITVLKEGYFKLQRENNVLKMELEALNAPAEKEVRNLKHCLESETYKNKQLMRELRRLQNMNNFSICEPSSSKKVSSNVSSKKQSPVEDSASLSCGSQVVLDVQVMRLKNVNYHLEKEKNSLTQENKLLNDHLEHYKLKAREWKTKWYKDSLTLKEKVQENEFLIMKLNTYYDESAKIRSQTSPKKLNSPTPNLKIASSASQSAPPFQPLSTNEPVKKVPPHNLPSLDSLSEKLDDEEAVKKPSEKENRRSKAPPVKKLNLANDEECKTQ